MDLANIIATKRAELRISQKELAERAGTTQQLINRYESGQTEPKLSTGIAILRALNYDLSNFSTDKIEFYQSILGEKYKIKYDTKDEIYSIFIEGTEFIYTEKKDKFESQINQLISETERKSNSYFKEIFATKFDNFLLTYSQGLLSHLIRVINNPQNKGNELLPDLQKLTIEVDNFIKALSNTL